MGWTSNAQTARFRAAVEEQQRQALAKRLTELRRYKGWTEPDLARESGVSIQTISRLENAKTTDPRENTLASLADAFGVSREDIAGPRLTPEAMDRATQTQLDRIEALLEVLISKLPDERQELERDIQTALRRVSERSAESARSTRSPRRSGKAR